jgi:hypothetical protein
MRVLFLWFPHRSPVLMLSLLLFSPYLTMAQKTSAPGGKPAELPDAPMPSTAVPDFQPHAPGPSTKLPDFQPHFDFHRRDDRLPSRSEAQASPKIGTADSSGKKKYFIGSAPIQWSSPVNDQRNHGTAHGASAWDHLSHHIPFANSVILRTSRLTKTHPHFARIIKVLKPKL